MTDISSDEHLCRMQWQAFKMLGEHQLLAETYWDEGRGARWLIGKPDTVHARCEIIAGIFGSLVVHGDFNTARFAHYGDKADCWSRLRWMADCTDVGYYVLQKARIGERLGFGEECGYDEDVARYDLRQHATEYEKERPERPEVIAILREAADSYTESEHALLDYLSSSAAWGELWESRFGQVVPAHVVISHVALNKCAWLLRERHGADGPLGASQFPPYRLDMSAVGAP